MMLVSSLFAMKLKSAEQLFSIILMFGAGSGLIFILRWFWWRINAWSEIAAMVVSGIVSICFWLFEEELFKSDEAFFPSWSNYPLVVFITTISWLVVMSLTPAEDKSVLTRFYIKIRPSGLGWQAFRPADQVALSTPRIPIGLFAVVSGALFVYGCLFAMGNLLYGNYGYATIIAVVALMAGLVVYLLWKKIGL